SLVPHLHSFPTRRSSDLTQVIVQRGILRRKFQRLLKIGHGRVKIRNLQVRCAEIADVSTIVGTQTDRGLEFGDCPLSIPILQIRSEEHTSELQSPYDLVC